jgi:hypothetical protein
MGARRNQRAARKPVEVFLSHAHQDVALTKRFATELRRHKVKCWFSEHHIQGGQQWQEEIGAALRRCDFFIVLLTRASVRSKWVKHEVAWVIDDRRYNERVLSILVEKCNHSRLNFVLKNLQMISHKNVPTTMRAILACWKITYRSR